MPRHFRLPPLWLLLSLPWTWAVLKVSVPSSPVRARPGSDAELPCYLSDSSGPLNLDLLDVVWRVGTKNIARYDEGVKIYKPGAEMTVEQLQAGNATLLLRSVKDEDAAVYTCLAIHMPDSGQGKVELRVEAPPHLTLSSTTLQLARPGTVTCTVSDFYPGNVSVAWLKNDVTVKGPELVPAQKRPDGLFSAQSVLELTPNVHDADANFCCRVYHKAVDGVLQRDFRLHLQARPSLQAPPVEKQEALSCLVSGFYPKEIEVQWLREGVPQQKIQSEVQAISNGTFTIRSVVLPEGGNSVSYVCRVRHNSLDAPLEQIVHWQPEGEGDGITCPTSLNSQSTVSLQASQPTLVNMSPTDSSSSVTESCVPLGLICLSGGIGLFLGLLIAVAIYYLKRAKNKSDPETKYDKPLLQEPSKRADQATSETENANDTHHVSEL